MSVIFALQLQKVKKEIGGEFSESQLSKYGSSHLDTLPGKVSEIELFSETFTGERDRFSEVLFPSEAATALYLYSLCELYAGQGFKRFWADLKEKDLLTLLEEYHRQLLLESTSFVQVQKITACMLIKSELESPLEFMEISRKAKSIYFQREVKADLEALLVRALERIKPAAVSTEILLRPAQNLPETSLTKKMRSSCDQAAIKLFQQLKVSIGQSVTLQ